MAITRYFWPLLNINNHFCQQIIIAYHNISILITLDHWYLLLAFTDHYWPSHYHGIVRFLDRLCKYRLELIFMRINIIWAVCGAETVTKRGRGCEKGRGYGNGMQLLYYTIIMQVLLKQHLTRYCPHYSQLEVPINFMWISFARI